MLNLLLRYFLIFGCFGCLSILANGATLSQQVHALLMQKMPHAHAGILIKNAKTDQVIYQKNATQYFHPASNTKLFTAMAALLALGADYRYQTQLRYFPKQLHHGILSGNLYIYFSGDPSLTTQQLKALLVRLTQKSIRQIRGDIIVNRNFLKSGDGLGVANDDLMFGYAAPAETIILNQNSRTIKLLQQAQYYISHQKNIYTHLVAANPHQLKSCVFNAHANAQNIFRLTGCLPKRPDWSMRLAILHPFYLAKQVIQQTLKQHHIQLKGVIKAGSIPAGTKILSAHHSVPLVQLLKTMLRDSNNLYANSLTKILGRKVYGIGSMKAGVNAINQILQKHRILMPGQIYLEDGAGLSYYNLITANATVKLLRKIYRNRDWRKIFLASLPISGKRGSLKYRMHHLPLLGHVFAKTGTLNTASNLSGYLILPKHRVIIFSILMNGVRNTKLARQVQDRILNLLAKKE